MTILHDAPDKLADKDIRGDRRRREAGSTERDTGSRVRRSDRRGPITSERATRSRAAQRAIDRRGKRVAAATAEIGETRPRHVSVPRVSMRDRLRHTPFVVPVLALLVLGLGLSLWLSTKAAQDSYRLGEERTANQALVDRRDSLKRTWESGEAAPELADKAAGQGMVPAKDPARMVVDGTKRPRIVGDPEPASGTPMGSLNPTNKPDPTETIDPRAVDDSIGLGGNGSHGNPAPSNAPSTAPATPGATTAPPTSTTPGTQTPTPGAQQGAQPGAAAPAPGPVPQPNVAP